MRILMYSHYFAPSVGGVERVVESLARGFAERGHRVTVVTEIPAVPVGDSDLPYAVVRQPGPMRLARLIREHDVVHLAGPALLPMFLAWLLRRPMLIHHHVYQTICPNGLLLYQPNQSVCPGHFQAGRHGECLRCNAGLGKWKSFRMWASGFPRLWLCKRAAYNVAITNHVQRRLSLPRSRVIYHGVPCSESTSVPSLEATGPGSPASFGFVGRFVAEKGLPVLVEAASRLHSKNFPFRLKLIGDGPERPKIEAAVRARGLQGQVTLTGMLRGEDLRRAIADAAAVVMPSIWEETAGMAAIEQMMRGRVVIASDIGGLGEIVDGAGLKFPPGDVEGLSSCMQRLGSDSELGRKLGDNAQRRAKVLFREEAMIDGHLKLCLEVGTSGPVPPAQRSL